MGAESIGILTQDPALYGELARFLRDKRVSVVSLVPGRRVPGRVSVVVTSEEEAHQCSFPKTVVARSGRMLEAWAAIQVAREHAESGASELLVGVDPGHRPGYAVLDGERCVGSGVADSPEAIALIGVRLRQAFPGSEVRFRVGNGDPVRQARTVNALLRLHFPVERVDERHTTLRGRRGNDTLSAMAIATTPGRRVSRRLDLHVTPGEIQNLQAVSRERSGGRITIPRAIAAAVLEGELSLGQALETTARAKRAPPGAPR